MAYAIIPSGTAFFDYTTYDQASGLFAGLTVKDLTANTAVTSPIPMAEISSGQGIYSASVTLSDAHEYLVIRRIYTDSSLATVDGTRAPETSVVYASAFINSIATILSIVGSEELSEGSGAAKAFLAQQVDLDQFGITIYLGDDVQQIFALSRGSIPVDLTNAQEISITILNDPSTGNNPLVLTKSLGGIVVVNPVQGTMNLIITSAQSQGLLLQQNADIDVVVTDGSGKKRTYTCAKALNVLEGT